jgi:hypothetical protein
MLHDDCDELCVDSVWGLSISAIIGPWWTGLGLIIQSGLFNWFGN